MHNIRSRIACISLVIGPLLMATGDLIHPKEDADAFEQAAIVVDNATRWYAAHLLLLVGLVLLIPGVLALTRLASQRRPGLGYASRILVLMGVAAFASIIAFEMLVGHYAGDGADAAAVAELIEGFQSGAVFGVLAPIALTFFIGTGLLVFILVVPAEPYRLPALVLAAGTLLILVEITSSIVLFSQVGNVVMLAAGAAFAWLLWRRGELVA